jgi:hypothetical protein
MYTFQKDFLFVKEQHLLEVWEFQAMRAYWRVDGNIFEQILFAPWYNNGGENKI